MRTLYLLETNAKNDQLCVACGDAISRGTAHFRHDPFPSARIHRGQKTEHYCLDCVLMSAPYAKDAITGRYRIPADQVQAYAAKRKGVSEENNVDDELIPRSRVGVINVGQLLARSLLDDPTLLYRISPNEFEEFVCDRLYAMGLEPKRVGHTNRKDGGIDVVFWPRSTGVFPFLGAAQVKHRRNPLKREGVGTVRDFHGAIEGTHFNAGIIVSTTSFSPDAEWFARERAKLIRLRGLSDVQRWISNDFSDDAEWREIPDTIELCPGVIIRTRG